jgi:hypothetical protein
VSSSKNPISERLACTLSNGTSTEIDFSFCRPFFSCTRFIRVSGIKIGRRLGETGFLFADIHMIFFIIEDPAIPAFLNIPLGSS